MPARRPAIRTEISRDNSSIPAESDRDGPTERQPLLRPAADSRQIAPSSTLDGGVEAWLFVLAGFFVFFNSWGLSSTFGVFLEHYRTKLLPGTSPVALSWIGSVQSTFITIMGLATGPLTDRGYLRPVMVTGHLMVVLGMLALSMSTQYYQVLLAQGFCVGMGAGSINIPAFAIISSKFKARRPIALGCASTGASIGGIAFPLVFRKLVPQMGFSNTVQLISLINLSIAIPTLVIYCRKPGIASPVAKAVIDPRGFVEPVFGIFVVALFFQFLAYYIPLFYMTTFSVVKLKTSPNFAFNLLAIGNAASFFGRTVPYLLGSRVTPIAILQFWDAVGIVLLFSWTAIRSASGMVVWTIAWGFLAGVLVTAPAASTAHPVLSPSIDVIGARLGMSWSMASVGVLLGAPIASALADVKHANFLYAQIFAGCVMVIATGLLTFPHVAAYRFDRRKVDTQ